MTYIVFSNSVQDHVVDNLDECTRSCPGYDLFTLPDSDSDSDSRANGYIALYRSFHIVGNQMWIPILTANYRNGMGIRVLTESVSHNVNEPGVMDMFASWYSPFSRHWKGKTFDSVQTGAWMEPCYNLVCLNVNLLFVGLKNYGQKQRTSKSFSYIRWVHLKTWWF